MKRIALIGCGAVTQLYYTPALHELERKKLVKVISILDPDPDNRLKLLEHFPDSQMILEIDELSGDKIDLGIVASPPDLHSSQTIKLLKMGISVLCEKPIATNTADAEAMIKASKRSGMLLAVGLIRRHFPAVQMIKKILDLNILGELKNFKCQEGNVFTWPVSSQAYFQKQKGGALMDIGVHALDLLTWWFGQPETIFYEDDAMGGIEVNCRIAVSFQNNIEGEVRLSRDHNLQNRYVFYGTKAWLSWDVNESDNMQIGFYDYNLNIYSQLYKVNKIIEPALSFQQSFTSQLIDVLEASENNREPLVPIDEALKSLRIIEYCYQNRNLIKMPWLSIPEYNNGMRLAKEQTF